MPHFFFNKKVILLLVGMVFLVALISFSLRDRTNATLPEQIIKDTVGVAQSIVAKPRIILMVFLIVLTPS